MQSFAPGGSAMEQHDQERSWKSDPRLHHMDAKKIALLASFADELAQPQKLKE